jgi:hypothetical protein
MVWLKRAEGDASKGVGGKQVEGSHTKNMIDHVVETEPDPQLLAGGQVRPGPKRRQR